jgi:hypothetical protein
MRGRSGCPGVGLGPLLVLAAPNGHRASAGRRGWWGWPGALSSGFGVRGSRFGLPVWPALPDSTQHGVAVGRWARMLGGAGPMYGA